MSLEKEVVDLLSKENSKISFNAQKKCKKLDTFFPAEKEAEEKRRNEHLENICLRFI